MTPDEANDHITASTDQAADLAAWQAGLAADRRRLRLISQRPGHEILPLSGTMYQVGKSLPANLQNPVHYPVEARCERCHRRVVCDQFYSDWRHEDPQP
jgi:hypothetical protein